MKKEEDGEPEFPRVYPRDCFDSTDGGMSLRDWYAGMALQAVLSGVDLPESFRMLERSHIEKRAADISRCSYALADAMLKTRGEA